MGSATIEYRFFQCWIFSSKSPRILVFTDFVHYFKKTITTLKRKGASEDANHLSAATVHWLRHTSVSEQVKVRDKHHVQQDVGHEDSKTTDNYIDSFDKERHQSMESFKLKPGN